MMEMVDQIRENTGHPLNQVCKALGVSKSSYYNAKKPSTRHIQDERLADVIEEIFQCHRARYGYRRIHEELYRTNTVCSAARIRRLMKLRGLIALQPKRFVPQTSDGRADLPSPNLLVDRPMPERPDQIWTGDFTYIAVDGKWNYLALVMDLCTRQIVGWELSENMRSDLVMRAFEKAAKTRRPKAGLIFHSDRGSQYGSIAFRNLLAQYGVRQSMSSRANPYENAWTESVIGTIKREQIRGYQFADHSEAYAVIFDYIESYYNRKRLHSALGYETPAAFDHYLKANNQPLPVQK